MKQMIEIPEFLMEMSKQVNTQDNRITADPIWQVCYDEQCVTAEGYHESISWVDINNEYDEVAHNNDSLIEYLAEEHEKFCTDYLRGQEFEGDLDQPKFIIDALDDDGFDPEYEDIPEGIEKLFLVKRKVVVRTCLTESDAKWFINRKQHDYKKLYTYVESMCYCPQMVELREWISSLDKL